MLFQGRLSGACQDAADPMGSPGGSGRSTVRVPAPTLSVARFAALHRHSRGVRAARRRQFEWPDATCLQAELFALGASRQRRMEDEDDRVVSPSRYPNLNLGGESGTGWLESR